MILFRTCELDHTSNYGKFKWGGIEEITEAPDWDANPDINCGNGLHATGEGCWGNYLEYENCILQIVEVDKQDAVRSCNSDKWRFKRAKTIKEYVIDENTDYVKLWGVVCKYEIEPLIFLTGLYWKDITNKMRIKAFQKLKEDVWIYYAGYYWEGITDVMRIEAFEKLKEDEWVYKAGYYWEGITDEMKIKAFQKIQEEEWVYYAGKDWQGITDEMKREKYKEMKKGFKGLQIKGDWKNAIK